LNAVQQIQSSCSLLIAIINDLLDCSKLEHGQLQVEHLSFALEGLVNGCIASIGPQAQSKGLNVKCTIDPKCSPYVISDPNRLRQILQNLLSNAVKFTTTGSISVNITPRSNEEISDTYNDLCYTVDQWLRFEVTDTGIGMDRNEQKVVFERYRQANASVARNYGGTGLGLPICKGLVELLGGTIGLHSKVGKGTTFYFDIPIRRAQIDNCLLSSRPSLVIEDVGELQSLNILVVDDNKVNQKVVKSMLLRMGHSVTLADNGEIALNEINRQMFHVVLMDIQMPVMDGIECTKYVRKVLHFTKEQLPIIGLTAGYQNSDRDYYENDVGMNGCLGKPLPMEKLKQSIAQYKNPKYPIRDGA
jgi:CheY-like chemotaxis protein